MKIAFQNPAHNYAEERLYLGDLVHLSPYSTFLVHSASACPDAGIIKGSILAVDRSLTTQHKQIIVAEVDGELALKRLLLNPVPALQALSEDNTLSFNGASADLPVWGVFVQALTNVAGLGFTSKVSS